MLTYGDIRDIDACAMTNISMYDGIRRYMHTYCGDMGNDTCTIIDNVSMYHGI